MPSRNPAWLNTNETRPYPMADLADLRSVQGDRLPHDIITDINIRYPNDLGGYPYLAALGVTDQLVSLTVQAATSLSDTSSLAPVAALGLAKPVVEGRPYALLSQYPGAGGWVVFGSGIQENFSGRFLGPERALLSPRAARTYRTLPVASMAKLNALTALTGLVRLSGRSPVEVVKEERTINGVNRDVVVFRLIQPPDDAVIDNESTIFREFLGKCAQRPESLTCGDPAPIEFINTVRPDCDGNITIEFQGCAQLARVLDGSGVLLDCELGLIDACALDTLAASDGKLRTEYPDECVSETKWLPFTDFENTPSDGVFESLPSESIEFLGELPYYECFAVGIPVEWYTVSGNFDLQSEITTDPSCDLDIFIQDYALALSADAVDAAISDAVVEVGTNTLSADQNTQVFADDGGSGADTWWSSDPEGESPIAADIYFWDDGTSKFAARVAAGALSQTTGGLIYKGVGDKPGGYDTNPYPSSQTGFWPLCSDAADRTTHNHNGTLVGGLTIGTATGPDGVIPATSFDGVDDQITLTESAQSLFSSLNSATISLWFFDSAHQAGIETLFEGGGGAYGAHVHLENGRVYGVAINNSAVYVADAAYVAGQWNHVVAVFEENGDVILYLNGEEVDRNPFVSSITSWGTNVAGIGGVNSQTRNQDGSTQASTQLFTGLLSQIQVFNGAVAAEQIKVDYRTSRGDAENDWTVTEIAGQSYESTDLARRNIALWRGFDTSSVNRQYTVDVNIQNAGGGSSKNASMVLNYRPHPTIPGRYQYFIVELDYDSGEFRIMYWNGTSLVSTSAFASVPGISLNAWYRLSVEVTPGAGSTVTLDATLDNVDAPALSATISLNTSNYLPDTGDFGVYANRSQTWFSSISVEQI